VLCYGIVKLTSVELPHTTAMNGAVSGKPADGMTSRSLIDIDADLPQLDMEVASKQQLFISRGVH